MSSAYQSSPEKTAACRFGGVPRQRERWRERAAYRLTACLLIAIALAGCATVGGRAAEQAAADLYAEASAAIAEEAYTTAAERLERLRADYPQTPHGRQAVLDHAYLHYRLGDHEAAILSVDAYLDAGWAQESEDAVYALYLRATAAHAVWEAETQTPPQTRLARRAFGYYRQLVERHPESGRAEEALRRMGELRRDLAREELRQARERLAAGALAEAAERAAWVAEQYPGLEESGDALALQAESLERLGRGREAAATRRMLEIQYPRHPSLRREGGEGHF